MDQNQWAEVDAYIVDLYALHDPILDAALKASKEAGLPEIQVTPNQGKMLSILAQSTGARSILEIGTLGGYSAIWMARALPPSGHLISLEASPIHAGVARANIKHAGLEKVVEIRVGPALDSLPLLVESGTGPFDLVFIDADKDNTTAYFQWSLKLTHPGSLIVIDNAVRGGAVKDAKNDDSSVKAMREAHAEISKSSRVSATAIQTVGSKGYDGFILARVN